MNSIVITKSYDAPAFCEKEALRYAGCKKTDENMTELLNSCKAEVWEKLSYKVCYRELRVKTDGEVCDFGVFSAESHDLSKNLDGCQKVILFSATVGIELDRLIAKYGRLSPSKALMFQAIGAERVEALCDAFCEDIKREKNLGLKPRFSPGYGDLEFGVQKDIFAVLDPSKRIGVTLNDSFLLSPSKSVTAFVGLTDCGETVPQNKCSNCQKVDCMLREV
ncbi:MAG: Vitamin B12 dependent methionine synthase activation subunit [Clostridia bacterium]|nr:Vitamin B12 dependent methionine synthase activation subunit [Clostridia bacterium]